MRLFVSFWGRLSGMLRHFRIFPLDSIRFFGGVLRSGLHEAVERGDGYLFQMVVLPLKI